MVKIESTLVDTALVAKWWDRVWLRHGNHGGLLANQRETLGGVQATSGPPAGTPQVLFLAGKAVAQQNDSQTCTDEATAGFAADSLDCSCFFSSQIQPAIKEESFSLKEFHLSAFSVVIIHFLCVKCRSELHCLTRTEGEGAYEVQSFHPNPLFSHLHLLLMGFF